MLQHKLDDHYKSYEFPQDVKITVIKFLLIKIIIFAQIVSLGVQIFVNCFFTLEWYGIEIIFPEI